MNGGCEDRRLVEVFQEHILWHALLLEVWNLWILLPENNLLSGLFGWLAYMQWSSFQQIALQCVHVTICSQVTIRY